MNNTIKNNINYIQKDIIDALRKNEINAIAHQCNCVTKSVSGFANVIFNEFPMLGEGHFEYIKDKSSCFNTTYTYIENDKYLINIYSQYYPAGPSNLFFTHNNVYYNDDFKTRCIALENCLKNIFNQALLENRELNLGIPLIASGLAADRTLKSNKTDLEYFKLYIEPILQNVLSETNFKINVYYL